MPWPSFGAGPVTGHDDRVLSIDAEGWLHGEDVERWPSVRSSARTTPDSEPIGIVWHYTAVAPGVPLWKRIVKYRPGVDRAASWHLLIERDGRIYQSVSFLRAAWHCAKGKLDGHRMNAATVGIELAGFALGGTAPIAQLGATRDAMEVLAEHYPIRPDALDLHHSTFDPARRADPGPGWGSRLAEMAKSSKAARPVG